MAKKAAKPKDSGLKTFSMHSVDEKSKGMMAAMADEPPALPGMALAGALDVAALDPESVARNYLMQAVESDAVPAVTAPEINGASSEFKSLGTETIPLTGTTTVKFRQMINKIPVYGSLATVELDEAHNLVGIETSIGDPQGVKPVARISPAEAVAAAKAVPGYKKQFDNIVPRLNYYFDRRRNKWRLVFILEDVPVTPTRKENEGPVLMDFIIDAHTGKLVANVPRTPTMAAVADSGLDGLGATRSFQVDKVGNTKTLRDPTLNVQTFDFGNKDPLLQRTLLPGSAIKNPPVFSPSAISAHANTCDVARFLRTQLMRNNIDNLGGTMVSTINCVVANQSPDGRQWANAFWDGQQMAYGQRLDGTRLVSMSIAIDVVAHENFHGVTDRTSRLEYANQSGALNESYSDIFGIIVKNFGNADPRTWNWLIGEGLRLDGRPFRNMADPTALGQPAHMQNFRVLPNTQAGDWGGVHINSGIHNKAAYNILTAVSANALVLTPTEVASVFYLALTQRLSRLSMFADSRRAVLDSARTLFRNLPAARRAERIQAIERGFTSVGI